MIGDLELRTVFLGALLLALLSVYTIEKCRRDSLDHLREKARFLFEGKSAAHSVASNIGSVFSVTYFFGATFIYSRIYRGSFIIAATIVFAMLFWLLPTLVRHLTERTPNGPHLQGRGNLLLDYLEASLTRADFRIQYWLFLAVYSGLLVEELAVSRLILATLFPVQPGVTTLILSTICFVMMAYLYSGGFRAVLISDYEQLKVIIPFTMALAVLIFRDHPSTPHTFTVAAPTVHQLPGLSFAIIFGLAWFASGVDFFSRLNLPLRGPALLLHRKRIARISVACLYGLLAVGIVFGEHLINYLPPLTSPTMHTRSAMEFFLFSGSPVIVVIFLVGMFCMIFTTLDTLLLSLLQVGHYGGSRFFQRRHLTKILLLFIVISTTIEFDAVSAIGIFIGSLTIVVFSGISFSLLPQGSFLRPRSLWLLPIAASASLVLFIIFYGDLKLFFDRHFLIPGIVLGCTLTTYAVERVFELAVRKERSTK